MERNRNGRCAKEGPTIQSIRAVDAGIGDHNVDAAVRRHLPRGFKNGHLVFPLGDVASRVYDPGRVSDGG